MSRPDWLVVLGSLDDDALAALANKGLLRRALKVEVTPVSITATDATVRCAGSLGVVVKLLPAGPQAAICPCPAAGICVHVVAACLWARQPITDDAAALPAAAHVVPSAVGSDASPDVAEPSAGTFSVLEEVLSWDPAKVNRAAGIAAVRKLAALPVSEANLVNATTRAATLTLEWEGSPQVIAVRGGQLGAMIVAGTRSAAETQRIKLEAVIRLWRFHGKEWSWPPAIADSDGVLEAEILSAKQCKSIVEQLVHDGLGHVSEVEADRLLGASQNAKIEDLPLLSGLLLNAAGLVRKLAMRDDSITEEEALNALVRAWALALAIANNTGPLPSLLRGIRDGEDARTGVLFPLGVEWWTSETGAHGFTAHWWDQTHKRVETLTAGRAAGRDPAFVPSWDLPLAWNKPLSALFSGPFELNGAQRRPDGWLSPTTKTVVVSLGKGLDMGGASASGPVLGKLGIGRSRNAGSAEFEELARAVNAAEADPSLLGFGTTPSKVTVVLPHGKMDQFSLDEVNQEMVWELTDRSAQEHSLRVPAKGHAANALNWLVASKEIIHAVVVADGERPISVFAGTPARVYSLTLMSIPWAPPQNKVRKRQEKLRNVQSKPDLAGRISDDPILRWSARAREPLVSVAVTGRHEFSPRQLSDLAAIQSQAGDLGLHSVAEACGRLMSPGWATADVLRVWFLLDRVEALAAAIPG